MFANSTAHTDTQCTVTHKKATLLRRSVMKREKIISFDYGYVRREREGWGTESRTELKRR